MKEAADGLCDLCRVLQLNKVLKGVLRSVNLGWLAFHNEKKTSKAATVNKNKNRFILLKKIMDLQVEKNGNKSVTMLTTNTPFPLIVH